MTTRPPEAARPASRMPGPGPISEGPNPPLGPIEDEFLVLTTDPGLALLSEAASIPEPGPSDLARWRKSAPPGLVSAAIRLARARRRASGKFAEAASMWLDPTGLEQATAEPLARHKAARFRGSVVLDLCSGIGGDALAIASEALGVIAVDRDPGMARRTLWNARVYGVDARVLATVGDARRFPIPPGSLVHVDPDRRSGGPRAKAIEGYEPGPGFLLDLPNRARGGSIKLGPASDFDAHFGGPGFEIELSSLGGECKEATAWFGDLATCRRRATVLPGGATWIDLDGPVDAILPVSPPLAWIFDPDPALGRSGLLGGFGRSIGLARVAPGIDYLTGPDLVRSPFLSAFEVLDVLPADLKRLRRLVADRRIGRLEIKTRGIDLRPESLRPRLRPEGPESATLLLYGGPGPGGAVLARRPD